ncbi:MAG TPA: hypothetical protein VKR61_23675 [Bryobacteraceae bacterium]|nr:hypothetical protein [Bryobacteraceae bacterium]
MKRFPLAAAMALCLCAWGASNGYTVAQIKSFVQSAIQLKNPDKEVAETLRKMKLAERLDLSTVETLQGEGAGPKTVAVLKAMATETTSLPDAQPPAPKPVYVPPPPPSSEEQAKLLDEVRDYAMNYTHTLPDFLCLEQTRRYVDTTGRDAWRLEDVITARLSYFNQREDYKLVSQNDRVITDNTYTSVGGALSMGDFGTTMREIFERFSNATFGWERWTTLRKRRTHVFTYRVPLEYSRYTIEYQGEKKEDVSRITVGYHGEIFVDNEYHTIVRIAQEADNIPASFPVREAREVLDYDFTNIGDRQFFLPLVADLRMHDARVWHKNVKEFRLYRKFSADAVIKFDGTELPPLPDDKTKEQPPQPQPPK